ncbi:MAG: hypothetical protein IJR70_08410 [Eubacterium sp.]|nr:hypothetical protein [Eubacterium sp.]
MFIEGDSLSELEYILSFMNDDLKTVFSLLDKNIHIRINEIRVRKENYLVIVIKNTSYFIDYNGDIYDYPSNNCVFINKDVFDEMYLSFCSYSVYSNAENIKNGFITLQNGSRIGIAGSAVYENEKLLSVKDLTSMNVRISKDVKNCSDSILSFLYVNSFPSIIVAGKPNSGKTTLLRDIARQLSSGFNHNYSKIAVIDERGEICGKRGDKSLLDIGINTDVLTAFSKAKGIEIATRTLSPQMIICDEVSTIEEVSSILYAFSSGIKFALSVHISSREDLLYKPIIKTLLDTREFSYIVLLENYTYKAEIIDAGEIYDEICRNDNPDNINNCSRGSFV